MLFAGLPAGRSSFPYIHSYFHCYYEWESLRRDADKWRKNSDTMESIEWTTKSRSSSRTFFLVFVHIQSLSMRPPHQFVFLSSRKRVKKRGRYKNVNFVFIALVTLMVAIQRNICCRCCRCCHCTIAADKTKSKSSITFYFGFSTSETQLCQS